MPHTRAAAGFARMRVWVNGQRFDTGHEYVTGEQAAYVYDRLLSDRPGKPAIVGPADWWLVATEKEDGTHWFTGGDPFKGLLGDRAVALARKIALDEYGEVLPEGELGDQQRRGPRVPPEYRLPGPEETY